MKQTCRGCKISQGAGCEGKGGDGKADDGKILKMPTIGAIDGCRIVDEPDVGEGEGGEAEELGSFVSDCFGSGSRVFACVDESREAIE